MLSSKLEEAEGRNAIYWPKETDKPLEFKEKNNENKMKIEFIEKEELIPDAVDLKKFKVNDDLEVKQMHILCWPKETDKPLEFKEKKEEIKENIEEKKEEVKPEEKQEEKRKRRKRQKKEEKR